MLLLTRRRGYWEEPDPDSVDIENGLQRADRRISRLRQRLVQGGPAQFRLLGESPDAALSLDDVADGLEKGLEVPVLDIQAPAAGQTSFFAVVGGAVSIRPIAGVKWSNDRPPVLALSSPAEWSDSFANAEFVIPLDLQRRLPAATAEKKTRAVMNLAVLRQYTETRCSLAQIDELISSLKKTISSTNPPVTPAGKVSVGVRLELFRAEDPRTFLLRNRKRARVEIQVYQIP